MRVKFRAGTAPLNHNHNWIYLLGDYLKRMNCRNRGVASCFLSDWIRIAEEGGIEVFDIFALILSRYALDVLNHCDYSINAGFLEELSNKIHKIE